MDDLERRHRLLQLARVHYEWSQQWAAKLPSDGREDGPVHHVDASASAEAHDDFHARLTVA